MRTAIVLALLVFAAAPASAQRPAGSYGIDADATLDLRVDELRRELDGNPLEGPAALTLTAAALIPAGIVGGGALMLNSSCWSDSCPARSPGLFQLGLALLITGVVSPLVVVAGAIWWGVNDRARRHISRRIRELEVRPDVALGLDGATLGLSGS